MTTNKILGATYKEFQADGAYWGAHHEDDVSLKVDGKLFDDRSAVELSVSAINDAAEVEIISGDIFSSSKERTGSLQDFYDAWEKQQGTVSFVVTAPKGMYKSLKESLRVLGATVK